MRLTNYNLVQSSYFLSFSLLTMTGMMAYEAYNYLPVKLILEIIFFAASLLVLNSILVASALFAGIFFLYVVFSYFYVFIIGSGGILDFLVIYKSFIYFFFLSFFVGKKIFTARAVERAFTILLICFSIKYALWLILGVSARPGIYGENNFELILLLLMFIACWSLSKNVSTVNAVLLGLVFLMSGSRSGVAALFAVVAVLSLRRLDYKLIVSVVILGVVGMVVVYTFASRMTEKGLDGVDRYVFFMSFLSDVSAWRWYEFILGSPPITPMSHSTCEKLSSYKNLFSFYDPSVCYSAILHSFVLRTIYDHGFLGLFFLLYFVDYGLKASDYSLRERICVVGVLFLTGLSVSSINTIFVPMALLVMYSVKRQERGYVR